MRQMRILFDHLKPDDGSMIWAKQKWNQDAKQYSREYVPKGFPPFISFF